MCQLLIVMGVLSINKSNHIRRKVSILHIEYYPEVSFRKSVFILFLCSTTCH